MRLPSLPLLLPVAIGMLVGPGGVLADDSSRAKRPTVVIKIYGEWRIRPRPGQGETYKRLIEQKGLAFFRAGGGRMIGW